MKKGFFRLIAILLSLSLLVDPMMASAVTGPPPFVPSGSMAMAHLCFQQQALVEASRFSGAQLLLKITRALHATLRRPWTHPVFDVETFGARVLNGRGLTSGRGGQEQRLAARHPLPP